MNLDKDFDKLLTESLFYALSHSHEFITPELLLYLALKVESVQKILESINCNMAYLNEQLELFLEKEIPTISSDQTPEPSYEITFMLNLAKEFLISADKETFGIEDFLVIIFQLNESYASYYLQKSGVTELELLRAISHPNHSFNSTMDPQKEGQRRSRMFRYVR